MYAIVEISGKQFKVKQNDKIEVDTLGKTSGMISFDKVLLYAKDDKNVDVGHPYVSGAHVDAEILKGFKGDKIRVFKKKSKKRFEKTKNFRRELSLIQIKDIVIGGKKSVTAEEKPKAVKKTKKEE
jgi:large subunit ribosomal protein L21